MKKNLKFNKDGKFKILIFGDPHIKTNANNDELLTKKGNDTKKLWENAVVRLNPDLVVIMGDIISADNIDEYRKCFNEYTSIIQKNNIPLAYVNGNHDHDLDGRVSVDEILSVFREYENCISFDATPEIENSINYYANILSSKDNTVKANLWFMDSNNTVEYDGTEHYDWVHDDQIEWYEKTARQMKENNGGKVIPSVLFQHIPVPEIYELTREAKPWEIPAAVKGCKVRSDKYYVLKEGIKGYMGEGPCPPCFNNYQFASWKKTGDVKIAAFGHDHMNDFEGYVDGIYLMQNKLSGLFAYTDGCRSGVRELILDENDIQNFTTRMIRFKDFGLKPESLGPVNSWMSDRLSVNLTKARNVALVAGGVITAGIITKKIIDRVRKDK